MLLWLWIGRQLQLGLDPLARELPYDVAVALKKKKKKKNHTKKKP